MEYPTNFEVLFVWNAASVPPPHYAEYTIHLRARADGEITYIPDYPQHHPPEWIVSFPCSDRTLGSIYAQMVESRLLDCTRMESAERTAGGELAWCQVRMGDKEMIIPAHLNEENEPKAQRLYSVIREVVPQGVWGSLEERRRIYHQRTADAWFNLR